VDAPKCAAYGAAVGERRMSYLKHVLQPGEEVRYITNIHWIVFLPGALTLVGAAAAWIGSYLWPQLALLWQVLAIMLFVLAVLMLVTAWFRRWTTEIAVTNKRIIYKRGFIQRRTAEMNMDKVASVDVKQSILGRIFDYGNVTVQAAGMTLEDLPMIENPLQFRNHITAG
jgi:uncharacterized membrane protein YdbT with pleckstrin-like domain